MIKRRVHIFDLLSLISLEQRPWIIEKKYPTKPLLVLSQEDYNLIRSGHFKSHDKMVEFSGKRFYLSNYIYNKLEKILNKKKLNFEDLGVSLAEFLDPELIDFNVNKEYFTHLKNTIDDIYLMIPDFFDIEKMKMKISEKFNDLGLNIKFFIIKSDNITKPNTDTFIYQKSLIILQMLTNWNIIDSKFNSEKYSYHHTVYYDRDRNVLLNIQNNLQNTLEKIYFNSSEDIQDKIKNKIISNHIDIYQLSSNMMNPLKSFEIKITLPNLVTKFESFKFRF